VYPGVPPEVVTEAVPVVPPLQSTGVVAVVAVTAVGCVKVTLAVVLHPFASVTVTVYDPAINPVAVAPVPPEGAHAYV
jgi:hypothetical protein